MAKRAGATVQELIEEFGRNRTATIKAVEEADEALMDTPVRTPFGVEAPLAAALNYVAVVHVEDHLQDIVRNS